MIKFIILFIGMTISLNSTYEKEMQLIQAKEMTRKANKIELAIQKYKFAELTLANVATALKEIGIINPDTVFLQTIKESGWLNKTLYKSKLATKYNNLFGMRKPAKRYTTCLSDTYCGYATYSYWIYSVIDYLYWQQSNKIKENESYKDYLIRRGYARNTKGYVKQFNFILPDSLKQIFRSEL
jgi:uncharacterized FlgJ-related protein